MFHFTRPTIRMIQLPIELPQILDIAKGLEARKLTKVNSKSTLFEISVVQRNSQTCEPC
jgi:hypothetical protein